MSTVRVVVVEDHPVTRMGVVALLGQPALASTIRERGSMPAPTSPADFDRFVADEIVMWGEVVRASGARAD